MELELKNIRLNQAFQTKEEAIRKAGEVLVEAGAVEPSYVDAMLDREKTLTTFMGNFVAIPHGTNEAKDKVKKTAISVLQVPHGVNFAAEGDPEDMAMAIFGIAGIGDEHLDVLSKISIFCSDVKNIVRLVNAKTAEDIKAMLEEVEN